MLPNFPLFYLWLGVAIAEGMVLQRRSNAWISLSPSDIFIHKHLVGFTAILTPQKNSGNFHHTWKGNTENPPPWHAGGGRLLRVQCACICVSAIICMHICLYTYNKYKMIFTYVRPPVIINKAKDPAVDDFPIKHNKKKKTKLNFSDTETVYFPAERWHRSMRNIDTVSSIHRPEPPRRASTLPPRDSLLREGVPGCVHPPWDIWDCGPSGLNLRRYQNRPWDQATQAVNMVMGCNGKAHHKWKFYSKNHLQMVICQFIGW